MCVLPVKKATEADSNRAFLKALYPAPLTGSVGVFPSEEVANVGMLP